MAEYKNIGVHESTFIRFKQIKVNYQAEIGKEISDNEFILELINLMHSFSKLVVKNE